MIYHYRCTNKNSSKQTKKGRKDCGKRRSLRHIDNDLKCECGAAMKLDKEVKKRHKAERCFCGGSVVSAKGSPHRRGTRGCVHAVYESDEDYEEAYTNIPKNI